MPRVAWSVDGILMPDGPQVANGCQRRSALRLPSGMDGWVQRD